MKKQSPPLLEVRDLGLCDYQTAYRLQKELVAKKQKDTELPDYLILTEHPDVYTFGRRNPIPFGHLTNAVEVERGGEATYHNPGQLVAYPILALKTGQRDLHAYLRSLEEVIIQTLGLFNVESQRRTGATGVWVENGTKKIASIGVAVSKWVTYHGIALNVNNSLEGFYRISPCGFSAEVMTNLSTLLIENCPTIDQVKAEFVKVFEKQKGNSGLGPQSADL